MESFEKIPLDEHSLYFNSLKKRFEKYCEEINLRIPRDV